MEVHQRAFESISPHSDSITLLLLEVSTFRGPTTEKERGDEDGGDPAQTRSLWLPSSLCDLHPTATLHHRTPTPSANPPRFFKIIKTPSSLARR